MRAACLSLVLCAAALVPADAHAATAPVTSVSALDLQRYAGTWHEQARLPLFFQRNCTGQVTATYRVRDDGLGFDAEAVQQAGISVGLRSMQARDSLAELLTRVCSARAAASS